MRAYWSADYRHVEGVPQAAERKWQRQEAMVTRFQPQPALPARTRLKLKFAGLSFVDSIHHVTFIYYAIFRYIHMTIMTITTLVRFATCGFMLSSGAIIAKTNDLTCYLTLTV